MFFINPLKTFITAASGLAFVSQMALASPAPFSPRDVIAPKITYPTAGTVWHVGEVQTVTWDTSNIPPDNQITNPIGKIYLGYDENNSLNLDVYHPLAEGFKLRDGSVQIMVPDVPPKDDYLIVLYGDSGNTSPSFTITKISSAPSPGGSSSSAGTGATGTSIVPSSTIPAVSSSVSGATGSAATGALAASSISSASSASASDSSSIRPSSSGISSGTLDASNSAPTSGALCLRPGSLGSLTLTACVAVASLVFIL